MPLTGYVTKSWEKGRFNDPYLRDTLMDFGIVTDTLECSVNWSNMEQVHADVRKVCHALPNTVVTTHMSHCYPQGANLYFIFLTKMQDEDAFKAYHTTILDASAPARPSATTTASARCSPRGWKGISARRNTACSAS